MNVITQYSRDRKMILIKKIKERKKEMEKWLKLNDRRDWRLEGHVKIIIFQILVKSWWD
jgi:hypothetical protein